jgi:hypothetical protein
MDLFNAMRFALSNPRLTLKEASGIVKEGQMSRADCNQLLSEAQKELGVANPRQLDNDDPVWKGAKKGKREREENQKEGKKEGGKKHPRKQGRKGLKKALENEDDNDFIIVE